jgi:hypothetical protein
MVQKTLNSDALGEEFLTSEGVERGKTPLPFAPGIGEEDVVGGGELTREEVEPVLEAPATPAIARKLEEQDQGHFTGTEALGFAIEEGSPSFNLVDMMSREELGVEPDPNYRRPDDLQPLVDSWGIPAQWREEFLDYITPATSKEHENALAMGFQRELYKREQFDKLPTAQKLAYGAGGIFMDPMVISTIPLTGGVVVTRSAVQGAALLAAEGALLQTPISYNSPWQDETEVMVVGAAGGLIGALLGKFGLLKGNQIIKDFEGIQIADSLRSLDVIAAKQRTQDGIDLMKAVNHKPPPAVVKTGEEATAPEELSTPATKTAQIIDDIDPIVDDEVVELADDFGDIAGRQIEEVEDFDPSKQAFDDPIKAAEDTSINPKPATKADVIAAKMAAKSPLNKATDAARTAKILDTGTSAQKEFDQLMADAHKLTEDALSALHGPKVARASMKRAKETIDDSYVNMNALRAIGKQLGVKAGNKAALIEKITTALKTLKTEAKVAKVKAGVAKETKKAREAIAKAESPEELSKALQNPKAKLSLAAKKALAKKVGADIPESCK